MFAALLAAAATLTPQSGTVWQVMDINAEAKRVLLVDIASRPANPKPDAIIKARIFVTVDMPEIIALTGYWEIDCGRRLHRSTESVIFNKAGVAGGPDPVPADWEATVPTSLFGGVEDYVCRGKVVRPGQTVTGTAPIAAANALLATG